MWFEYGRKETDFLARRDPALGELVTLRGHIYRPRICDPFASLLHSIAGQQISGRAHQTVWARLSQRNLISPEAILACPEEALGALGLGPKKARWARACAERARELDELASLSDAECVRRLTDFPGVGRWTAEMFLLFCLNRMDVLSKGDFGIRKGLALLHGETAPDQFDFWRELYSPYGSVASLYLWELAAGTVPGGKHAQF